MTNIIMPSIKCLHKRDAIAHDIVRISPGNKFLGCLLLISNTDHIAIGPLIALELENLPSLVTYRFDSMNF